MRAAVFKAVGEPLAIESVPDPRPESGDLILKVKCCGICGSDLHLADLHDRRGGMAPLPSGAIMGHEFSGEVVEVGTAARGDWRVGDRVTALPYIACGSCAACLSGIGHRCAKVIYGGLGRLDGAYADYVRIGAAEALRLPAGVDWRLGALVEPLAVALHAVHAARLQPGDSVLIVGARPIGLAAVLWCRHFGARHVAVSDKVPERLALAERLGADGTIDASKEDVIGTYKKQAGGRPEVVIDCVGVPGSQQLAMDYAPTDGRVVVVGVCMAPDTVLPVKAITKELQINYVFMYRKRDFQLVIDLLDRGRIDPSPMLSDTVTFDGFATAFDALKTDKTKCKVMLTPGG